MHFRCRGFIIKLMVIKNLSKRLDDPVTSPAASLLVVRLHYTEKYHGQLYLYAICTWSKCHQQLRFEFLLYEIQF